MEAIILLCVICAFLSFAMERTIYNPAFFVSVLFGFMAFLSNLRLYGIYEVSRETQSIFFWGLFAFNLAFFIRRFTKKHFALRTSGKKMEVLAEEQSEKQNEMIDQNVIAIFVVLAVIACVYMGLKAINSVALLLRGVSLSQIRQYVVEDFAVDNPIFHGLLDYIIYVYVIQLFFQASMAIGVAHFYLTKGKEKKLLIISVLSAVFMMLTNGGRTVMLTFAVEMFGGFLIFKRYYGWKVPKRLRRIILIALLVSIGMILYVSSQRKGRLDLNAILKEVYVYFGYVMPFADYHMTHYSGDYTYGFTFFYGLLDFPCFFLHNAFRMPYPSGYGISSGIGSLLQAEQVIGKNWVDMNAFATMFFFFFINGGAVAVPICSFLYSSFVSGLYMDVSKRFNLRTVALYMIALSTLLQSFIRYQYHAHTAVYATLLIMLLLHRDGSQKLRIKLVRFQSQSAHKRAI